MGVGNYMSILRVLHVIDEININSGVNSVVMNYYKYIDKSKIRFDFIVHKPVSYEYIKEFEYNGSSIYVMPELKPQNFASYIKELNCFFREKKEYQIVHGHLPNAAVFYLGAAKRYNVPVRIIHSHNSISADTFKKKIRNNILNSFIPFVANHFMTCSDLAARSLFGRKADKAFLLYNAIDTDSFMFSLENRIKRRKELGLTDDQLLIGHVGRFCNQKNHSFLVDIFSKAVSLIPDSRLLLIGQGELYNEIQEKVKMLDLSEKVIFLGLSEHVNEYLHAMDVFVLPSLFEGLPVSAVEAQTAGLACFLSDTITPQTIFSDNAYFLSLKDSPLLWAEKICGHYKNKDRKGVYNPDFDIKVQARRLENYYMELSDAIKSREQNGQKQ
jgi:glycosyltransferase involved in cell wall biosynthesis